jgi:acetyltransferase-like isoleucine patch superfamily enzyme
MVLLDPHQVNECPRCAHCLPSTIHGTRTYDDDLLTRLTSCSSYAPMMATEHARAALRVGWDNNRGSPLPGNDNNNSSDTQYGNIGLFKPQESLRTARRKACLKACAAFNNAATMSMSDTELQRLFSQIVHPEPAASGTTHEPHKQTNRLGKDVRVEAPFRAEMGENLHIGDGVSIDSGCYFKDSYTMYIANNTRIGANVTISAEWVPPDPKWREWSRGVIVRIGENVYIGPGVTISPSGQVYKPELVIGDDAYIAAGTVVTRVSFSNSRECNTLTITLRTCPRVPILSLLTRSAPLKRLEDMKNVPCNLLNRPPSSDESWLQNPTLWPRKGQRIKLV